MRIKHWLRLLIGSFVVIFLMITVISLFFPSRVRVSRAMNVLASQDSIQSPISDFRRWQEWNPFLDSVSADAISFSGNEGQIATGMKVKDISVTWTKVSEGELTCEMRGLRGKPVVNGWQIIHHPQSDSTTVNWYMDFKLSWYPWEKFSGLLIEKSYGPRLEEGLQRLRRTISANLPSL